MQISEPEKASEACVKRKDGKFTPAEKQEEPLRVDGSQVWKTYISENLSGHVLEVDLQCDFLLILNQTRNFSGVKYKTYSITQSLAQVAITDCWISDGKQVTWRKARFVKRPAVCLEVHMEEEMIENTQQGRRNEMATPTKLSPTSRESMYSQDMQLDEKSIPRKVQSLCSVRYGMALIVHVCNFIFVGQNAIINITMVAMVNSTSHQSQVNVSTEGLPVNSSSGPNKVLKSFSAGVSVYNWSPQTQGIIFGSVNYGMLLTIAPSGYLAGRVGTKLVVGAALFGSSLFTLCIPLAADLGLVFLIVTRIIQGICQGSGLGGQYALWEKWSPPHERSRLCSIALSGIILGHFTAVLLGGLISQILGWPFGFYIFGAIGCVYSILWIVLVYDDPISHPRISILEKEYILSSLAQQVSSSRQTLPLKAIVRSLPFWSMSFCCFSHQWLVTILAVYTPTYISSVFNVNLRDNGFLSSFPFIFAWIFGILGGQLSDFLLTKNFRLITLRKLATTLGNLPSSVLIVVLPYFRSSFITTIIFLTLACGLSPLCQSGIYINALDIAPRYSSFLMGVSREIAHTAFVLVPTVSGFLLNQDPEFGWRNIFFLMFAVNMLGLLFYLIFGEADVQDWAKERKTTHL